MVNKKIKIIGIGGCGTNSVTYLSSKNLQNVDLIIVNTDKASIERTKNELSSKATFIHIGDNIKGGVGDPQIGYRAVLFNQDYFKELLQDTEVLFLIAGMGGGTGSGASIAIAELAKKMGIVVFGLVTMPFTFEGLKRKENAMIWTEKLLSTVNGALIFYNDMLLNSHEKDKEFTALLSRVNDYFLNTIKGLILFYEQKKQSFIKLFKDKKTYFLGYDQGKSISDCFKKAYSFIESNDFVKEKIKEFYVIVPTKKSTVFKDFRKIVSIPDFIGKIINKNLFKELEEFVNIKEIFEVEDESVEQDRYYVILLVPR